MEEIIETIAIATPEEIIRLTRRSARRGFLLGFTLCFIMGAINNAIERKHHEEGVQAS
jgi:hypothetical protein